mgnify:CR=1 FL=1
MQRNMGYDGRKTVRQRQQQQCTRPHCQKSCPAAMQYIGNVFLLGLSTLLGELIDLRAASALETLLEPFQGETGSDLEQDILAAGLGNTVENVDVLGILEQNNTQ